MGTVDFERALEFTLRWEGGYVNHPSDPGGATNRGITQVTYNQWRTQKGLPTREVRLIEEDEVRSIYWQYYWAPVEGRTAPSWVQFRVCLFDTFVQFGVLGGTFLWQKVCGVPADGKWGPVTSRATENLVSTKGPLWSGMALVGKRVRYRAQRVSQNRSQLAFLQGWLNRDTDLLLYLLNLR